jgi:hypothetical protein
MRILFNRLSLSFILVSAAVASAAVPAPKATHSAGNQTVSDLTPNNTDLPPLLAPVDALPQLDRSTSDSVQNVPVEAVPAPTAVASGLLVLGGLATVRIVRRLRLA